ncbi:MAG: ssDNA-binding protein [Patescibacteria group bacterium]
MSQDGIIFLSDVRLSFPNLIEPQRKISPETGKETISYNCELIMPADHAGFGQFMQQYGKLALEKWKEHANAVMQMIAADRKSRCYGAGAEKINKKTMQVYGGYEGNVWLTCGRTMTPQMIQTDGTPIDAANTMAYQQFARKMYGGCRVNAAVKPWLQDNKHGRGVRCDLIAIQFARDDKPFGEGSVDASGMFGAVAAAAAPQGVPGFAAPTMPAAPFPQAPMIPGFLGGQ